MKVTDMNEDFYKLVKLSGSSAMRYYNHIRGWNDGSGHHNGLIEKQNPELWKTPLKAFSLSYIYKVLFNLKLSPTELKVALIIIGHTWNFAKASEIISREQFINGKDDSNTDQCLVGPAGISPSSLTKSIDSLVEKGIIRRITIAHPSGPKPLYSPNPVIGGKFIYKTNPGERDWKNSNYPKFAQEALDLIQAPVTSIDCGEGVIQYELLDRLIKKLRHIELLPLFIVNNESDFQIISDLRKDCQDYLNKEIQKLNPGKTPSPHKIMDSSIPDIAHGFEDHVNHSEREWIESDEVQNHIAYLTQMRVQVDSPLPSTLSEEDAEMQVKLLYLRWGDTLLTVSVDAWDRFHQLITKYGASFNPFGKSIIEKYNLMKIEREKIPWIKKSAGTYYKTKKVSGPKNNNDDTSTLKPFVAEIDINSVNTKEINQHI